MVPEELNRRDFHRLSTAALCGLIAGTTLGCGDGNRAANAPPKTPTTATPATTPTPAGKTAAKEAVAVATIDPHACRGLNVCKGLGKSHKNSCAGKGDCYTVKHECSGQNDCKFQGGCGGENGLNDCKGKGGCGHFPIADNDVWKKARTAFESRLKAAGKAFGPAPAPSKT